MTGKAICAWAAVAALGGLASAREIGSLVVTSSAFANNGAIPREYTCEGRGVSPPISWSAVPPETKSVAVIVDDADAPGGTFAHFVAFNLTPGERALTGALTPTTPSPYGLTARNSGGTIGFAPICPPAGVHHYRVQVTALDTTLARPIGANASDVASAIEGHVIARGTLVGTYQKSGR